MSPFQLADDQVRRFREDGFFVAERLFDAEETDLLGRIARADRRHDEQAASRRDGQGGAIRLRVENELGVMTQVATAGGLKLRIRDRVLREAVAL